MRTTIRTGRVAALAATLGLGAFATTTPAHGAAPDGPYGKGDVHKGKIELQLYRGGAVPFELSLIETPQECTGEVDLKITWDEEANSVKLRMRSEPDTLEQFPDIDRTEGVDYFPNPFFEEPEDVVDGRYQLWLISAAGPIMPFYYDLETLDLLGSVTDFDEPPMAIPVPFPTLYMFATPTFQPKNNGKVKVDWEFPYDSAHRGDLPEFSHHYVTFPPPNLCFANPFPGTLHQSLLRPYISDPQPREDARPWSDYLRGGILFDITIEPADYFSDPPTTTLAATYSGGTAVGGAIPRGWQLDIEAAFAGLAPPVKKFAGRDTCEQYMEPMHVGAGVNFCELMGG